MRCLKKNQKRKTIAVALDENVMIQKVGYKPATFNVFRRKSNQLKAWIGGWCITDVTATHLGQFIAHLHSEEEHDHGYPHGYNSKTINQYLTILRQIFTRAVDDGLISLDPMRNIKTCKTCSIEPDSFSQYEIQTLMTYEECYPIEVALITIGIGTGLRISELMALTIESIDLDRARLSIDLALVDKKFKTTKTKSSTRFIELTGRVLTAAKTLVAYASARPSQHIEVLQNDNKTKIRTTRTLLAYSQLENRPYVSVDDFRETFFKPYCALVRVRYRGPSLFRHTYASQMLTAGVAVERIARKMGLASTEMIYRHYGKWMVEDAPDYQAVEDTVLDLCFGGSAKQVEATLVNPVQPNVRNITELGEQITMPSDDSLSGKTSNAADVSINPAAITPVHARNMEQLDLIHQASLRWGGEVRCLR